MTITLKTRKILWMRSGGRCSICKNEVIVDASSSADDPSVVADEAHIVARKETFTRGDFDALTPEQRDQYSNLILLCKVHHKVIDDQPAFYTVERLREIKAKHEDEVRSKWTDADTTRMRDEEIYAGYIDEWVKRSYLENWDGLSSCVTSSDTPWIPQEWYASSKELLVWIIGRIWPHRYPGLESAVLNYKAVLHDFLNVFDRHINTDNRSDNFVRTDKFYRIENYDPDLYHRLLEEYGAHECLVCDLFFELTRAANYVCDHVRQSLFSGFRLQEGALLILRGCVGWQLETVRARVEYRDKERTEFPYPGLKKFKTVRYERDYALDPRPMRPPLSDDEET